MELDWPPIGFQEVNITTYARFSGMVQVVPVFDRLPYGDWCVLFVQACEAAPGLDWKGAGFALCSRDEVDTVTAILAEITASTNDAFRDFLARARESQPDEVAALIALEGSLAASEPGPGYLCTDNP